MSLPVDNDLSPHAAPDDPNGVFNRSMPRRPVHVCFVIDRLSIAGTENQLRMLIDGLDRRRVVPHLCLLRGADEVSRSLEPAQCEVLRLEMGAILRVASIGKAWRLVRFLRKHRIDIVQTYFPDSTYFAAPLARLAGVRHVVRARRDLGYWMRPIDRRLARIYRAMLTATIANCEACRQAVIEQEGWPADRVVVLPNGIDLKPLLAIPPLSHRGRAARRKVGMVANLRPIKAPEDFLRAAARLAPRFPEVTFHIAGSGDEDSARCEINRQGLGERVYLWGDLRNVPEFLADLDVAVLSSRSEGLSNTILEYMAAARPIVATAVGGTVELIDNKVHGLLAPPENPDSLAAAIGCLLEDPALAAALGAAARRRATDCYSGAAMICRHEDFYQRLVQHP